MTTYQWRNASTSDYYRYSDENWALLEGYYNTAKAELTACVFTEPEGWETMDPATITADGERQRQQRQYELPGRGSAAGYGRGADHRPAKDL